MVKKIGLCSDCGLEKSLLGNGKCGSCSGKLGGRPPGKLVKAPVLSPLPVPVKMKTVLKPDSPAGLLEYLFSDDAGPITDEKPGDDAGLDSTWLILCAGIVLIIIYAVYGDRLKGLFGRLSGASAPGKNQNPYNFPGASGA